MSDDAERDSAEGPLRASGRIVVRPRLAHLPAAGDFG